MSGLDFSAAAIEQARALARRAGTEIDYHVSDVYRAVEVLGAERYDFVFTGIGALCWLPDIARWAEMVAGLLRPGGRLFLREGHPVLWATDLDRTDGSLVIDSRTSSGPSRRSGTNREPTSTPRPSSPTPGRRSGTTASARS